MDFAFMPSQTLSFMSNIFTSISNLFNKNNNQYHNNLSNNNSNNIETYTTQLVPLETDNYIIQVDFDISSTSGSNSNSSCNYQSSQQSPQDQHQNIISIESYNNINQSQQEQQHQNIISIKSYNNNTQEQQEQEYVPKYTIDSIAIKRYTKRIIHRWIKICGDDRLFLSDIPAAGFINVSKSKSSKQEIKEYVEHVYDMWQTAVSELYSVKVQDLTDHYENAGILDFKIDTDQSIISSLESTFIASVCYFDTYFIKYSKLENPLILSLLDIIIPSICVSIKMWVDEHIGLNMDIAEMFDELPGHVKDLEEQFLKQIDYNLSISDKVDRIINYINTSGTTTTTTVSTKKRERDSLDLEDNHYENSKRLNIDNHSGSVVAEVPTPTTPSNKSARSRQYLDQSYNGSNNYNNNNSNGIVAEVPTTPIRGREYFDHGYDGSNNFNYNNNNSDG